MPQPKKPCDFCEAQDPKTSPDRLHELLMKYRKPAQTWKMVQGSGGLEDPSNGEFTPKQQEDAIAIVEEIARNPSLAEDDYWSAAHLAPDALAQNPKVPERILHGPRGIESPVTGEELVWTDKVGQHLLFLLAQKLFICERSGTTPSRVHARKGASRRQVPLWLCSWRKPEIKFWLMKRTWPGSLTAEQQKATAEAFDKEHQKTFRQSDGHSLLGEVFADLRATRFAVAVAQMLSSLESEFGIAADSEWVDLLAPTAALAVEA